MSHAVERWGRERQETDGLHSLLGLCVSLEELPKAILIEPQNNPAGCRWDGEARTNNGSSLNPYLVNMRRGWDLMSKYRCFLLPSMAAKRFSLHCCSVLLISGVIMNFKTIRVILKVIK